MVHIKFLNDAQNAIVEEALADAKSFVTSESTKLVPLVTAKYPALVTAFKAAFNEVENDTSVTGIAKMGKAVALVIPQIPAIAAELTDLPNLEDFLINVGQTVFTDGLSALESAAGSLVSKLVAAL